MALEQPGQHCEHGVMIIDHPGGIPFNRRCDKQAVGKDDTGLYSCGEHWNAQR